LNEAVKIDSSLVGKAILAFPNDTVNDFNNVLLERMPGEEHSLEAINHVNVPKNNTPAEPFPVEHLQSISLASIQPSCLRLKIGHPLILIQNLSPREGICNGTRMSLLGIRPTCLQVAIFGGRFDGMICLLPWIKLTTSDEDLPFNLVHTQIPVNLCFTMT